MTSVHGITVFGGTFPAEIWNAFYSGVGVPCQYFQVPAEPVELGPVRPAATRPPPPPRASPPAKEHGESTATGGAAGGRRTAMTRTLYAPGAGTQQPGPGPQPRRPAPSRRPHRLRRRRWGSADCGGAGGGPLSRARLRGVGTAGLAGLLICAVPLAAPGTGLVPSAVGDGPDWLLGLYGGGTGIGPGPYLGLLCLAFAAYLCVIAGATALPRAPAVVGDRRARRGLRPGAAAALPGRLQLHLLRAARAPSTASTPTCTSPPSGLRTPPSSTSGGRTSVSAYGPLFTLLSYPLGSVGVPVALWTMKAVTAVSVLGVAVLCARLAPARGLDPRLSAALVALNPLVLVHVVGGAHNEGADDARRDRRGRRGARAARGHGRRRHPRLGRDQGLGPLRGAIRPDRVRPAGALPARRRPCGRRPGCRGGDRLRPPRARRDRARRREPGAREPPQPSPSRRSAQRRRLRFQLAGCPAALRAGASPGCCAGPGAGPTGSGPPAGPGSRCWPPAPGCFPGTCSGRFRSRRSPGTALLVLAVLAFTALHLATRVPL